MKRPRPLPFCVRFVCFVSLPARFPAPARFSSVPAYCALSVPCSAACRIRKRWPAAGDSRSTYEPSCLFPGKALANRYAAAVSVPGRGCPSPVETGSSPAGTFKSRHKPAKTGDSPNRDRPQGKKRAPVRLWTLFSVRIHHPVRAAPEKPQAPYPIRCALSVPDAVFPRFFPIAERLSRRLPDPAPNRTSPTARASPNRCPSADGFSQYSALSGPFPGSRSPRGPT